jgi:hypothetical protein
LCDYEESLDGTPTPTKFNNEFSKQKNDVEGIKRKQMVVGGSIVSNVVVIVL